MVRKYSIEEIVKNRLLNSPIIGSSKDGEKIILLDNDEKEEYLLNNPVKSKELIAKIIENIEEYAFQLSDGIYLCEKKFKEGFIFLDDGRVVSRAEYSLDFEKEKDSTFYFNKDVLSQKGKNLSEEINRMGEEAFCDFYNGKIVFLATRETKEQARIRLYQQIVKARENNYFSAEQEEEMRKMFKRHSSCFWGRAICSVTDSAFKLSFNIYNYQNDSIDRYDYKDIKILAIGE